MSAATLIQRLRAAWRRRRRWQWVQCRAWDGDCCMGAIRDGDSVFLGCYADAHNDWIAERWWRRWTAYTREALATARARITT